MSDSFSMHQSLSQLRVEDVSSYLKAKGWEQSASRYADRIFFEGATHEGGRYELYLPADPTVAKYRTLIQRAIYKLSGIEEKEPAEIVAAILVHRDSRPRPQRQRIRVKNSGSAPLSFRILSRDAEHQLLPDEAVEVVYEPIEDGVLELEHRGSSIVLHDK